MFRQQNCCGFCLEIRTLVCIVALGIVTPSAVAQTTWTFEVKGPKPLLSKKTPEVIGSGSIVRQPQPDGTIAAHEHFEFPLKRKQNNNAGLITISFQAPERIVIDRRAIEDQQGRLLAFQETVMQKGKVSTETTFDQQTRELVVKYQNACGRPSTKRVPVAAGAYADTFRRALLINPHLSPLKDDQKSQVTFAGFHCEPYDVTKAEPVAHWCNDYPKNKAVSRVERTCLNYSDNPLGAFQRNTRVGGGWCESGVYAPDGQLDHLSILWKHYEPVILQLVSVR